MSCSFPQWRSNMLGIQKTLADFGTQRFGWVTLNLGCRALQVTLASGSSKALPGQQHRAWFVGFFKRAHAGENSRVYYYTALVNKAIVKERSCILNFSREALSLCETDRPRESCNWWGPLRASPGQQSPRAPLENLLLVTDSRIKKFTI